jgi:hypothetical protein
MVQHTRIAFRLASYAQSKGLPEDLFDEDLHDLAPEAELAGDESAILVEDYHAPELPEKLAFLLTAYATPEEGENALRRKIDSRRFA